jgi:ferredoxin--NADP+ reductase
VTADAERQIAIIGAGPAGCYLADHLLRLMPDALIDVIERLPVPFGLIRYGVAPDHQGTKAASRVLDRVLARDRVAFLGNVEVGRDVRLDELLGLYDAVVLATGAGADRRIGIPGEDLPGVVPSGVFVGWYNAHPDRPAVDPRGARCVTIVGNGNVAIDVARVLAKGAEEMAGSDLPDDVAAGLAALPLDTIRIVGRGDAAHAKFTAPELAELGRLVRTRTIVADSEDLAGEGPVLEILRSFQAAAGPAKPVALEFRFGLTPEAFLGRERLEAVRFRDRAGGIVDLPSDLAVTCIGYEALACDAEEPAGGVFPNEGGRVRGRLYAVGWARRGPTGTIPTNRAEAQDVAKRMAAEVLAGGRDGGAGLRRLLTARGVRVVDHAAWRRIDQREAADAGPGRCRRKLHSVPELLIAGLGETEPR